MVPIGSAVIVQGPAGHTVGPLIVDDLSPGTMAVHGPAFENLSPGEATVLLTTPEKNLELPATVMYSAWQQGGSTHALLSFRELDADAEDAIQDVIATHLDRSHMPMTIVLDNGRLRALGIDRFLLSLGRYTFFPQNSLTALWVLERYRETCGTIVVDHSFIRANGPECLLFLCDEYPEKRRVLVLPGVEPESDVASMSWLVHGVLTTPWSLEQLKSALGLFPAEHTDHPKRILFVDDEPAALAGLQRRLHRYLGRYETVWATSGEAALSESKAHPFDVVVTDLRMPGMDGLALLRAIKAHAPASKRIVLSGWPETYAARDIADVILSKPCTLDSLRLEVLGLP